MSEPGDEPDDDDFDDSVEQEPSNVVDMADRTWKSKLIRKGKKGPPKPILANVLMALRGAKDWRGVLFYNGFSHTIEVRKPLPRPWPQSKDPWKIRPWCDHDDLLLAEWMQLRGIDVSSKLAADGMYTVAKENEVHPVREYFAGLKWDGVPRLETWLPTYLGTPDTAYERMIGPKYLVSMVARITVPGSKVDCVLMLIGDQGQGKSTALEALVGKAWFTDQIGSVAGGKETSINMAGKMLVEFSDLEGFHGRTADELKAFLSRTTDRYRAMFGRYAADYPRQVVFAGTTNQRTPLKDFTGNRRFWPIQTGPTDIPKILMDRDQLFAEAIHLYHKGHAWWLDTPEARALADEIVEESREVDMFEEMIAEYLNRTKIKETTVRDILVNVFEKDETEVTRADQMRVAGMLQALKWERFRGSVADANGMRRYWAYRPSLAIKSK